MSHPPELKNAILRRLSVDDARALWPFLEFVKLPAGYRLAEVGKPIMHVYFLESGIGSIITVSPKGAKAEAGMFGSEGFGPMPPAVYADTSAHEVTIHSAGHGYRINVQDLWMAMDASPRLNKLLTTFLQSLATQVSFTALSNAVQKLDARLARWLLMCHDRVEGDEVSLTHNYLALIFAVRRASVTTSLHFLEGRGYIKNVRKLVTVRNRSALRDFASEAYGQSEEEYDRLFSRLTTQIPSAVSAGS